MKVEGIHTEFLCQIVWKQVRRLSGGTWETPGEEGVREAVGTKSARTYIERRRATVEQWVVLRPLFEVCAKETWYEGGGGAGGRLGGANGRQRNNFGTPWQLAGAKRRRGGGENVTP